KLFKPSQTQSNPVQVSPTKRPWGGRAATHTFLFALVLSTGPLQSGARAQTPLPSLEQVTQSKTDLWGEAAMRQPGGASYEFFEKLLPPPRYVNADFRFYPIVLSAPNAKLKARLISNGSGVTLRGGSPRWYDVGTPVIFRAG